MTWPTLLIAGFLLGLAHGAHCAGMCGVFALHARRRFVVYALGKTCTYMLLGAFAGATGAALHVLAHPMVPVLGVAVGVGLVLGGWRLGWGRGPSTGGPAWIRGLTRAVGDLTRKDLPGGPFTLGALTGALPCGAVALAVLQAALAGDAVRGAGLAGAFGVGTLPALGAVALVAGPVKARLSAHQLRAVAGGLVMIAGLSTVVRAGMPWVTGTGGCCS